MAVVVTFAAETRMLVVDFPFFVDHCQRRQGKIVVHLGYNVVDLSSVAAVASFVDPQIVRIVAVES